MSIQQYRPGDAPSRVPRGSACLSCRRRKMRCDGVRPVCGQCVHMEREYDCEYTDGPMPSPTQLLERDVARLEARIRELESDPQRAQKPPPNAPKLVGSSHKPSASSSSLATMVSASIVPDDPESEVHQAVIGILIGIFVPHASQVGFFMNIPRFLDAAYIPNPAVRRATLSPALLDCVLLWGAHFSNNHSLKIHEPTLLSRAVGSLASGKSLHDRTIQTIQAEVLLANYFFCQSRMLEGTYHCSAAVALALSCKLNRVRSASPPESLSAPGMFALAPPRDTVEEGERINAFWAAYIVDRCWSAAQGSHANDVFVGVQIDTPWPQEMGAYEEGVLTADLRSYNTVNMFLNDPISDVPYDTRSMLALRAKAATLFERATRLASQWSHAIPDFDGFYVQVYQLDAVLRSFAASLPSLDRPEVSENIELAAHLLVTRTYVLVAAIRLHNHLEAPLTSSIEERPDLIAAKEAADAIDSVRLSELPFLDPILAMLWSVIARVFIDNLKLVGPDPSRQSLLLYLGRIMNTMALYTHTSALMASQMTLLQNDLGMLNMSEAPGTINPHA
ncbi:hypothetical protein BXZ70DRAFT_914071 [Cristinia sonorae]|uniref:Zn(2)-C6 fungal-type domain-containing protein n=1 Tax=Cristinia sonorae TaxID=1940300 RepID=A0A8K0XUY9_9AGAR|nr:hypothetical protein BXZ70DRAFT_914071 [Cristinia sonorae]